jgi:predicted PhzF superfamily epimerase YddE/YHI9
VSRLHVLRVFCDEDGRRGNPLAVFLEGGEVAPGSRQAVATDLGLSETVFVDDAERGELRIFTPTVELPFAGHPTVGSAWLLAAERAPVRSLRVPAGELPVRYDDGATFVAARPERGPAFEWEQLDTPAAVEALGGPPGGHDHLGVWAWIDESVGAVRARVFPVRYGVAEDEATGSAAAVLCAALGRPLELRQGRGSLIHARPLDGGFVEIGGTCALDEVRDYA